MVGDMRCGGYLGVWWRSSVVGEMRCGVVW